MSGAPKDEHVQVVGTKLLVAILLACAFTRADTHALDHGH